MESAHSFGEQRFWGWAQWWLRASHLLLWGAFFSTMALDYLLQERYPHSALFWHSAATFAQLLGSLWLLWALSSQFGKYREGDGVIFLLAMCWGLAVWQREHISAVVAISLATAACFWLMASAHERLTPLIAVIGWLAAGMVVLPIPWPNSHRFWLAQVIGGLATAVQGAVNLGRHLRDSPQRIDSSTTNTPSSVL